MSKYNKGKYRISIAGDEKIQNKVVSIVDDTGEDALGGGGGGTSDYEDLENLPSVNGVTLEGDMTSEDLGVYSKPSGGIPESDLSSDVQQALQKHFKGWYDSSSNLPANPVVGDYAYVKGATSTDPAAIYECTTAGTWSDSGRTADTSNVQTFASGEEVNEIFIDNDFVGGSDKIAGAEEVKQLYQDLYGSRVETLLPSQEYSEINFDTTWGGTADNIYYDTHLIISPTNRLKSVSIFRQATGAMNVYFIRKSDLSIVTHKEVTMTSAAGFQTFNMTLEDEYYENGEMYVGINGSTSFGAKTGMSSTTSYVMKISDGTVTSNTRAWGILITTESISGGDIHEIEEDVADLQNDTTALDNKVTEISSVLYETKIMPSAEWINGNFAIAGGGSSDFAYFDDRTIIPSGAILDRVRMKAVGSNTITVFLLKASDCSVLTSVNKSVVSGINDITPDFDSSYYTVPTIIAVGSAGSPFALGRVQDTGGEKHLSKVVILTGEVTTVTGYNIAIDVKFTTDKVNADTEITTLSMLKNAIAMGGNVKLGVADITLDETLNLVSGTKISGILGKSILRVPSTVLKGIEVRNVEDVTIEGITIVGAYNGTPIINSMQPVMSGIVDTVDDAKNHKDIGYQTDMTNGGVTSEYIPQIGINIYGCEKLSISNCEIKNFSYYGICNGLSGKNYRYACRFIGNYINNCYCGLHTYNEAERSQYYGNSISLCQIGVHLDSGTNMFTDNAFNANNIGMMMTNGVNHAHGFQKGNAYTHCTLFNLLAIDIANGEIFSNCKFGYVEGKEGNTYGGQRRSVVIMNSRGIFFDSCYFFTSSYFAFIGKFNKVYSSYTVGAPDEFGNTPYVVTYNTIENGNGVNKICDGNYNYNNSSCVYFEGDGVTDGVYVVRKDNINIEGTGSNYLNSPS